MGLDGVLSDLEASQYTTRTFGIPACAVDAPHRRERVWIVAHGTGGIRRDTYGNNAGNGVEGTRARKPDWVGGASDGDVADAEHGDRRGREERQQGGDGRPELRSEDVAHAAQQRFDGSGVAGTGRRRQSANPNGDVGNADGEGSLDDQQPSQGRETGANNKPSGGSPSFWDDHAIIGGGRRVEPGVRLLAHGIPARVAKLRALGNAVVPQIVAEIAKSMMGAE